MSLYILALYFKHKNKSIIDFFDCDYLDSVCFILIQSNTGICFFWHQIVFFLCTLRAWKSIAKDNKLKFTFFSFFLSLIINKHLKRVRMRRRSYVMKKVSLRSSRCFTVIEFNFCSSFFLSLSLSLDPNCFRD